jgi:hypothetical protein
MREKPQNVLAVLTAIVLRFFSTSFKEENDSVLKDAVANSPSTFSATHAPFCRVSLNIHAVHHLYKEEDVMLHRSLPLRSAMVLSLMAVALICASANAGEKNESLTPKEVSKQVADNEAARLLEKAFGAGCEELRRPIQVWIPDIGIIVAAKEFSVISNIHNKVLEKKTVLHKVFFDGEIKLVPENHVRRIVINDIRVRLKTISFALLQDSEADTSRAEINLFRGDEAIISLDRPVSQWRELRKRQVLTMEARSKQFSIILTPRPAPAPLSFRDF